MNKLLDLIYISLVFYLLLPFFINFTEKYEVNESTIKVLFLVIILFLEILFYSSSKLIFKNKINVTKMIDMTLQNSLFYLLGYSLFIDYSEEIIQFTESNFGSSFVTFSTIGMIIAPQIGYTIIRSFLKPY